MILRRGAYSEAVGTLQDILTAQGALRPLTPSERGIFGPLTERAVALFQSTHLGPEGAQLDVSGVVDVATWWALRNPDGEAQRQHIPGRVPRGLTPQRLATLEACFAFHAQGVREVPGGSNRGDHVDTVLPGYVTRKAPPGPPWCCYCAFEMVRRGMGAYPCGAHIGSCYRAWVIGTARGMVRTTPIPGDIFLMLYRDADGSLTHRGHAGIVTRVGTTQINTAEGNCGNRFALGLRDRSTIAAYLNPYGPDEQPTQWERGVLVGERVSGASTR